ncbi:DBD Tnp Mut domain-containing protein [Abeliophyllum distichum]|uniref:DBD Tnp Mut domain-containing protein n=1 Tax=Abeliophyllum distichum TaxID=126358 RepID=A0ABD1PW26_9LAMI
MDISTVAEECLLEEEDKDDASGGENNDRDIDEDELDVLDVQPLHFNDSEDEVNDGEFIFDKNAPERIAMGLNSDPLVEEAHIVVAEEGVDLDESYSPSSEELHTDYSSGEENNYRFPNFVPEKELFDPKFEVGKTFTDMELFRKAVKNHGFVTRCNFRFRPNDDRRAQAVCKLDCKWRIWASLNKKLGCVQVKSYTPIHTCSRDSTNRHCTAKYVAERYLETFKIDPEWNSKLIRKAVKDDLKLNINKVTSWRARRWARILIQGG